MYKYGSQLLFPYMENQRNISRDMIPSPKREENEEETAQVVF